MNKKVATLIACIFILSSLFGCTGTPAATTAPAPTTAAPAVQPTQPPAPTEAPTAAPTASPTAAPTEAPAAAAISVTDFRGKQITLAKPAERIACVLPNVLNDLLMLGLTKEIVGVHKWSLDKSNPDYPFITQIEPRLASGELEALNGNVEKIVSLKPDIVILQAGDEIIPTLEKDGVQVYGVQVNDFDGVTKLMADLGALTGRAARAKEINDYTQRKLAAIQQKIAAIADDKKPKGMFVWGPSTLDIAGGVSTGNAILLASGAKNVSADVKEEHIVAKMEQVVTWNPDVIVLWYTDKLKVDNYLKDAGWASVSAVAKKQVYMLPNGFYTDLWTPKYEYAILATATWMYPDLFPSVDLAAEQKEMIKTLYNYDFKY
jgi:iron complex transport system substrate-binding protein